MNIASSDKFSQFLEQVWQLYRSEKCKGMGDLCDKIDRSRYKALIRIKNKLIVLRAFAALNNVFLGDTYPMVFLICMTKLENSLAGLAKNSNECGSSIPRDTNTGTRSRIAKRSKS